MREFSSNYGICILNSDGSYFVDGKRKFEGVKNVTYMSYKRDTHAYLHFKRGIYKLYSLKDKKVLLNNFTKIIYKAKSFVVVVFEEDGIEKYYLHHFIDKTQSRYIKKQVGHTILEENGINLTLTKPTMPILTLPQKCIDLCEAKSVIDFYAITENNEIIVLAPYPYNFSDNFLPSKTIFWKLNQYIKYRVLKNLPFKALKDYILFESEEDKKIFTLVSILYKYKSTNEKIFISNIKDVLNKKQIILTKDKFKITLTLDEIIINDRHIETKYLYDIFDYDDSYLENLLIYHSVKSIELTIRNLIQRKLTVDEIEKNKENDLTKDILKKYLYKLNCNPNSKIFYIINNENRIIMTDRKSFVEKIQNALLAGKSFAALMNRYDLRPDIIRKMLKEIYYE